jgi:ribosome-interacting GTPase 1
MPANLTPEYKAAEHAFRKARDPARRLESLREMLRTIPKHKGTDHLQGDIKTRIKELTEAAEGAKKGSGHGGPALFIHPDGAAQIALIGPPNSGKSSLHVRLTGSNAHVASYPFTTQYPEPGMMPFEDIHFQLVDLPAVSPEHAIPWIHQALQTSDACLLVLDLSDADCVDRLQAVQNVLRERRIWLTPRWPGIDESAAAVQANDDEANDDDPFALRLPTLMVASKADLLDDVQAQLQTFRELAGSTYPAIAASASQGRGLGEIAPWLFRALGIVRVYTKTPGHPADRHRPFALHRGETVESVARLVHLDVARSLRYARVWGKAGFEGQQVGREHPLSDGDIVELHT